MKLKHLFNTFLFFAMFLAFLWSPPETKAQQLIVEDTLGVRDSAKVVVISPYCGDIYLDVFNNGIKNDTIKVYEIPYRCDTGTYPQFRILFCQNQAAVSSNLMTLDTELVNIKTHQGTFNTWKILDRNPWALMIVRCNDSGMAGHPTHFKIRVEHKYQWNMNFKFPDEKYLASRTGNTYEQSYKLTAGHKNYGLKESFIINRREFANGLTNRLRL